MASNTPSTNYGTDIEIYVGEDNTKTAITRSWIKANFEALTGITLTAASLNITPTGDLSSNARTMTAYRCLRAVTEGGMTWDNYAAASAWGTAGAGNSSTDYDGANPLGTLAIPASPTLNSPLTMTLDHSIIQAMIDGTYQNNGILLMVATQVDDLIKYASRSHGTPAYRPTFTLQGY